VTIPALRKELDTSAWLDLWEEEEQMLCKILESEALKNDQDYTQNQQ